MKVIIPAAGIGARLWPHTHTLPKALLHVAGKPILAHILDTVAALRPAETIIVTGFLGNKVRDYVSAHYDLPTRFVHQEELLGLGYAVRLALEGGDGGPVLIILGDTIVETDLRLMVASGGNLLGLTPVEDPKRFGIAEVTNGNVTRVIEKPPQPTSNQAIIGLYYISDTTVLKEELDRLMTEGIRSGGEVELTDALQGMIGRGLTIKAYPVDGWYDCGQRETLIATNRHLLAKMSPPNSIPGSIVVAPSYIAPTARIEGSVIGPYVSVSDRAVIINAIITNSIVGYEAEVRDALLTNSLIGHHAVVTGGFRALNVGDSSEIEHF